ncbi:MAG: hypothetical protein IKH20_00235 [Clostridiales bacterium]|nr:hypothetical protein [Clostridiales bacterium]
MKKANKKELDINELQGVSGGYLGEVTGDSELLHNLGLIDEELGLFDLLIHWESNSAKVDEGWGKVGVTCESVYDFSNAYFYQGKKISRTKAYEIAKNAVLKGPQIKH